MEDTESSPFPSLPKRLVQVFFSPGELFTTLRDKPVWGWALVVVALLVALSLVLIPGDLWVEFNRNQLIERGQEVPAGAESALGFVRVFAVLGGVIVTPIMMFLLAGIVTFIFSFLMGDEGRYVQYLSVVTHASIISAVGALLLVPLKIAQRDPSVTLNLGTFAFFLQEGYFFRVLKLIDLFALWSYAVMAIGVTKISPRRGFASALTVFFLFAVAFALIFGSFGG